jgi:translation initiation factor 1 (eIF-1/SUI1)
MLSLSVLRQTVRRTPILTSIPKRYYFVRPESLKPLDPKQTYTKTQESADEFDVVERLLGQDTVPQVPEKSLRQFPTPSGWIPPAATPPNLLYFVHRTRYHNLPVYLEAMGKAQTKKLTRVNQVQGDIWKLEKELIKHVRNHASDGLVASQVSEVNRWIKIKGNYVDQIKEFLLEKGF